MGESEILVAEIWMKARENPFRSECVDALDYRAEGFSWEGIESRLVALGGRGAIVAPQGHGKTTLLWRWAARAEMRGESVLLVRAAEKQRRLAPSQRARLQTSDSARVFVDSAEQLSFFGWLELRWLTRHAKTLVVTTHRPGRLRTLLRCRTSPALLEELVRELTGQSEDCTSLWRRHRGNVRTALAELYARGAVTRDIPAGSSR